MSILKDPPILLSIPIREEPTGILRVGQGRVLLDLVIRAHRRGASPRKIVEMYPALELGDVYAVIAYYLAHPGPIDVDLRRSDEEAERIRSEIERAQGPGPSKAELLARSRARGLNPCSCSSSRTSTDEILLAVQCLSPEECRDVVRYFPM